MQRTKQEIAHTKLKLKCNLDFKKKHFKIILLYFQSYLFKNFYLGSIDSQYRKKNEFFKNKYFAERKNNEIKNI